VPEPPTTATMVAKGQILKTPGDPIPRNQAEMQRSPFREGYVEAERVEMETHRVNGTWKLVPRSGVPSGVKIMPTRWV